MKRLDEIKFKINGPGHFAVTPREIDYLIARVEKLEAALKVYAGETEFAQWDGVVLLTGDKFGGLCAETSGPFFAKQALAEDES